MKNKLYNIEFGSFMTQKDKIVFSISKELFSLETQKSLDEIKAEMGDEPYFLPIEKAEEEDRSYLLTYPVDFGTFKNLKAIKLESPAIRLAIAKTIMEQDILNTYHGYVSVYPANIWYHPMRTVKYAYRSKHAPVTENESKLVRYKALLLYILIGYPYGKALHKEYRLEEKKNPFAAQVAKTESIEELTQLISDEEDTLVYEDIRTHKAKKSILKVALVASAALLLLTNLITFMSTRNALAVSANTEIEHQLQEAKDEISSLKINGQIQAALSDGDFKKVGALMEENKMSRPEIADFMLENNKYNLALQYNPDLLETILQSLYEQEKTDMILDLKLEEGNEDLSKKLGLEQSIITYNTEKMDAEWSFTEDRHTLLRAAVAYMSNGKQQSAKDIYNKMTGLNYQEEAAYINALITRATTKESLNSAEKGLEDAKALPEDDTNRPNRITEAENNVNTYSENLTKAEEAVTTTKEQLKEAWNNESKTG